MMSYLRRRHSIFTLCENVARCDDGTALLVEAMVAKSVSTAALVRILQDRMTVLTVNALAELDPRRFL